MRRKCQYQDAVDDAAARLFNWLVMTEKAAEIAGVSLPGANAKTRATITATKANIAAYSVIACPERLFRLLVNGLILDFISRTLGALVSISGVLSVVDGC